MKPSQEPSNWKNSPLKIQTATGITSNKVLGGVPSPVPCPPSRIEGCKQAMGRICSTAELVVKNKWFERLTLITILIDTISMAMNAPDPEEVMHLIRDSASFLFSCLQYFRLPTMHRY